MRNGILYLKQDNCIFMKIEVGGGGGGPAGGWSRGDIF